MDNIISKWRETERLIAEVEAMNASVPNGAVIDSDTILADLMESCDYHFSGFSGDVFEIWRKSFDRDSVEKLFYEFTDVEFRDFLEKCLHEIV